MREIRAILTIGGVEVDGYVELDDEPGEYVIFRADNGGVFQLRRQLVKWIVKG